MKQANLYLKRTQTNYCSALHSQVQILFTWILYPNVTSHTHKAKPGLLEKEYLWNYFKSIAKACLICHIIRETQENIPASPRFSRQATRQDLTAPNLQCRDFNRQNCGHHEYPVGTHNHKGWEKTEKCCKRETYSGDLGFRQLIIWLFKIPSTFHTPNSSERTTWQRKGKMTSEMTLALINSFILWAAHEEGKINAQHTWA